MADNQASIKLSVDGASEAKRAAQDVEASWSKAARGIGGAWQGVGRTVAGTVASAVQDLGRVALAAETIDFAGSIRSAIDLQGAIERMSLASGRNSQQIKREFTDIGNKIGEQPQHVAAWQRSLNRTLYDFDKATKATDLLGRSAFEVGRSFDEMAGFGSVLGRSTKDAGELARSLGVVRAQAALLGKDKGASLFDNAERVAGGVAGKFAPGAIKSKGGLVGEASAIQTALIEQGLPPEQAAEAAGKLLNDVAADPRGFERQSGLKRGSLTDQFGRITKSPIELLQMQQKAIAKMAPGDKAYQRQIATNVLGPLAGGAATGLDFDRVQTLANLESPGGPSPNPLAGAPTLASEAEIARRGREAADPLLPYVQQARGAFASHPITGAIGSSLLSGAAGFGLKALFAGGGSAAATGAAGAGTAGGAATAVGAALTSPAALLVGAGATGLAAGAWIDSENSLSDRLAIAGSGGNWTSQGAYRHGIELGIPNKAATDYAMSPEAQALIEQQMATTRARNVAGPEFDPAGFLFPSSADRFGVPTNPSQINEAGLDAAFVRALGTAKLNITLFNQTGAPIGAVTSDKANANVSQ